MNQGEISELVFACEAVKRGAVVSRPVIQCHYDLLVDIGGRVSRVQVKSTAAPLEQSKDGYWVYRPHLFHGRKIKKYYTVAETDYVACHLVDINMWYFLPVASIGDRGSVRIAPEDPNEEFNIYKNAWIVMSKVNGRGNVYKFGDRWTMKFGSRVRKSFKTEKEAWDALYAERSLCGETKV